MAIVRAVALVAFALLISSCGGSENGGASGPVNFLVFGEPVELEAFRDVAEAFERTEPDIDVRLIEASDREDLLARLSTWPEIEDAAEGILENGLYQNLPAADVARRIDRATRQLFARAER